MVRLMRLLPVLALVVVQTAMTGMPVMAKTTGPTAEQVRVLSALGLTLSLCGEQKDAQAEPECPWCHTVKDAQIVPPGWGVPGRPGLSGQAGGFLACCVFPASPGVSYRSRAPPSEV